MEFTDYQIILVSAALCHTANTVRDEGIAGHCNDLALSIFKYGTDRNPELTNTAEYVQIMCGPIGRLIIGQSKG